MEMTDKTRAWIEGRNDANAGNERKARYADQELIEAYAAGYDSVEGS